MATLDQIKEVLRGENRQNQWQQIIKNLAKQSNSLTILKYDELLPQVRVQQTCKREVKPADKIY